MIKYYKLKIFLNNPWIYFNTNFIQKKSKNILTSPKDFIEYADKYTCMRIGSVQSTYTFAFAAPYVDSEEQEIAAKLLALGETPTGDKTTDRAKLHRLEYEKAKQESTVSSNKFLTVSTAEQERIQDKKKEKRKETTPKTDEMKGAAILAEYNRMFLV